MAGFKVRADGRGFHRSRDPLNMEFRKELLAAEEGSEATVKRIYSLLLILFSNQAVIMDALGELQEGQGNTMTALDDLTDAVNSAVGIEQAAVNLLATLEGQVVNLEAELAAAGTPVDDSAALSALKDTLAGGAQKLSDAINAAGGIGGSGGTTTVPPISDGSGTDSGTSSAPVDGGTTSAPTPGGDDSTAPSSPSTGDSSATSDGPDPVTSDTPPVAPTQDPGDAAPSA